MISRTPRRIALALVLGALAAGCGTTQSAQSGEGAPPPDSHPAVKRGPDGMDYAMVVPENVLWLPWKVIGGSLKGASDGVQAGFDKGRMPALGAIFSPVNLVAGFVTGFFEGAAMSPGLIAADDDFGRTMASPTKRTTTVWWYP